MFWVTKVDKEGLPVWLGNGITKLNTRAGITHVDLALSGDVTLHPLRVPTVLRLEGHVQFSTDDATRPTSASPSDARRSAKLWAALVVRLSPRIVTW